MGKFAEDEFLIREICGPSTTGLMEKYKESQKGHLQDCFLACFVPVSLGKDGNFFPMEAISMKRAFFKWLCKALFG